MGETNAYQMFPNFAFYCPTIFGECVFTVYSFTLLIETSYTAWTFIKTHLTVQMPAQPTATPEFLATVQYVHTLPKEKNKQYQMFLKIGVPFSEISVASSRSLISLPVPTVCQMYRRCIKPALQFIFQPCQFSGRLNGDKASKEPKIDWNQIS